jgi:hypothetical protein
MSITNEQQAPTDAVDLDIDNLEIAFEDEAGYAGHGLANQSTSNCPATWWASCYCKITSGLCPS